MNHLVIGRLAQISRCARSRLGSDLSTRLMPASTVAVCRHMSSDTDFKPSEELAKERYDTRSGEDIDRKRARLLYQSRKRGMLENGVILASFADKYLQKLDADLLDQYDRLINLPTNDWDIYYWATKTKPTPVEFETPVMDMLRQHLKSKVSSDNNGKDTVLGKSRLDDIVLPAVKKTYELDIDVSKVDLTSYEKELFDNRTKTFASGESIQLMTTWRKRFFERRLRRVISSPTSVKTLSEETDKQVYTQGLDRKDIGSRIAPPDDLIVSEYDKSIRHHEFLQHLLSSQLTDDPTEYDDEAQAWADMLWHRNYGSHDDKIAPSTEFKCKSCQSNLHCCDSGLDGYVPREIFISIGVNDNLKPDNLICQRCNFSSVYNAKLSHEISPEKYVEFLRHIATKRSAVIIVLVDLTDFPGSIWEGLIDLIEGRNKKVIIVGNKIDLLPYDGSKIIERVAYSIRKNLDRLRPGKSNKYINDITLISARTGFGVEGLVARILSSCEESSNDVYLIGSNNSGKSTLFSALLQSDLCAIRKGDLVSRVSRYQLPKSDVNMLRFPINLADGWQIEMKRRRQERVERNTAVRERSLGSTSMVRQESMPHMSMLINRTEYIPAKEDHLSVIEKRQEMIDDNAQSEPQVKFSDDHPLANIEKGEPMSATREAFESNTFFYHTPSSTNPDQLHDLLTRDERLEVFCNETIIPRKYSLRPLQTIFIAGLARLDLLTSQSNVIFTIFASKYLPVHVIQTKKADKFYNQFLGSPYLGVPFGDETRLAAWPDLVNSKPDFHIRGVAQHIGAADIVFSSVGWAVINMIQDQECVVRAYTPEGRGIFLRDPPLLSKTNVSSLGRKIRDTPVFNNPNYKIKIKLGGIESIQQ